MTSRIFLRLVASHLKYEWGFWKADPDPTYYVWLVVNCVLSRTVSELLAIAYKPKMTSRRFLRQVASHLKCKCGFWKADTDLLLVVNCNFCSILHRFRVISDCLPEMTLRQFLRQVASHLKCRYGFWKPDPDLLLVVKCNFCSISHRFRVINDCLQTGNDVTPISRQVASHLKRKCGFWKADPVLLLVVNCNFCSISHRFRVISDCFQTGKYVTPIYPLGGAASQI